MTNLFLFGMDDAYQLLPPSLFLLHLWMKYVFFVCGGVVGGLKPPSIPTLDSPLLFLKNSKRDMLEANRETPTKPQSLVDDLSTTY